MSSDRKRGTRRVVLVGRPNVGKSTLFNRVAGSRRAIVTPVPGTTRDVLSETVEWLGSRFELVDTGGLYGVSDDPLQLEVAAQGMKAVANARVIVMLVDGREGLVSADEDVAQRIRRVGVPVVLAVNKVDDRSVRERIGEFHLLGLDPVVALAAEHGLGVGDLLDEIVSKLPGARTGTQDPATDNSDEDEIGVAIVGRPNVGKSSLVNLLAQEERVLVNERAGTTRDAIDTVIRWHGQRVRLVDTAGMRRPGKVARSGQVEAVSIVVARRALRRADVAVLVVDANSPLAKQDAAIAGEAERSGCGIVIAANKWDLVKDRGEGFAKEFDEEVRWVARFAEYAPIVHLSALTGERAPKVIETVGLVARARKVHVATAELNRFLDQVTRRHRPASPNKKEVRILYGTQVSTGPPTFLFFTNRASSFHFSYERFLRNRLRESFGFTGTPIRLKVRARREPRRKKGN